MDHRHIGLRGRESASHKIGTQFLYGFAPLSGSLEIPPYSKGAGIVHPPLADVHRGENVVKTIPESNSRHMKTAWSPAQSLHGEALLFHEQKSCAASQISGFGRGHAVSAWRNEPQSKMSRCRKLKFTAGVGHPDTQRHRRLVQARSSNGHSRAVRSGS